MRKFAIFFYIVVVYINRYTATEDAAEEPCKPPPGYENLEAECADAEIVPTGLKGDELIEIYFDPDANCDNDVLKYVCSKNADKFDGKVNLQFIPGARIEVDMNAQEIKNCPDTKHTCASEIAYTCGMWIAGIGKKDQIRIDAEEEFSCCALKEKNCYAEKTMETCGKKFRDDWAEKYLDCTVGKVRYFKTLNKNKRKFERHVKTDDDPVVYPAFKVSGDKYKHDACTSYHLAKDFSGTFCKMLAEPQTFQGCT